MSGIGWQSSQIGQAFKPVMSAFNLDNLLVTANRFIAERTSK